MQLSALCRQFIEEPLILLGVFVVGAVLYLFWQPLLIGLSAFVAISAAAHYADTETPLMRNEVNASRGVNDFVNWSEYQREYELLAQDPDLNDEVDMDWMEEVEINRSKNLTEDTYEFKPASQVSLIHTDNEEYKTRRAKVLKRSDAVVMQKTFR